MANITKTTNITLLALQSIGTGVVVEGSAVDVSTKLGGTVFVHWGRENNTALTAPLQVRIEGSAKSSGEGYWFPLAVFGSTIAAITSQAVNGTCNSGQKVIAMTSTTGMNVGDVVFIKNGTLANSEWGRITVVTSNTSITIEDNLVNAQTGATVYPSGAITPFSQIVEGMLVAQLDFTSITRVRAVAGYQTAQSMTVEILMVTGDSIG